MHLYCSNTYRFTIQPRKILNETLSSRLDDTSYDRLHDS